MRGDAMLLRIAGNRLVRTRVNRAFLAWSRRRTASLAAIDAVSVQEATLRRLVKTARHTRFGRDHGFAAIQSVRDYQKAVPLRTYEDLWQTYFKDRYPVFDHLTWPGRIPY